MSNVQTITLLFIDDTCGFNRRDLAYVLLNDRDGLVHYILGEFQLRFCIWIENSITVSFALAYEFHKLTNENFAPLYTGPLFIDLWGQCIIVD